MSSGEWVLLIKTPDNRSRFRLYKTESGAVKAAKKKLGEHCRVFIGRLSEFKDSGTVRQISISEIEPEY